MTSSEKRKTTEMLVLKPSWLRKSGPEKEDNFSSLLLFISVASLLVGFLVFSGGRLKELVAFLIVGWVSFFLSYHVKDEVKPIKDWIKKEPEEPKNNLPLERKVKKMERATEGFELSQFMVEKKLRAILIEKIKGEQNLDKDEKRELFQRASLLQEKVIQDEILEDFLKNKKDLSDVSTKNYNRIFSKSLIGKEKSVKRKKEEQESYEQKIKYLLKRISERG